MAQFIFGNKIIRFFISVAHFCMFLLTEMIPSSGLFKLVLLCFLYQSWRFWNENFPFCARLLLTCFDKQYLLLLILLFNFWVFISLGYFSDFNSLVENFDFFLIVIVFILFHLFSFTCILELISCASSIAFRLFIMNVLR